MNGPSDFIDPKDFLPRQFLSMETTMAGEQELAPATAAKYGKDPVFRGAIARFPRAFREVAKVSSFGFQKHKTPPGGELQYLDVPDAYVVYSDAVGRHLVGEAVEGQINHADGGLYHAAQAAWNALARLEVMLRDIESQKETA